MGRGDNKSDQMKLFKFFAFYYMYSTVVCSYSKIVLSKRKLISRLIMEISFLFDL